MVLLIDNYDSFVHNLARYLEELGQTTQVVRNDAVSIEQVIAMGPEAIVISPGPCSPGDAGISVELIRRCAASIPILGVCLGHQAIAEAFGGNVVRAAEPVHGRTSWIRHANKPLFDVIANPFRATRYHSLVAERSTLPDHLAVTAWTDDGVVMAIEHQRYRVYGVQFHPESVLTQFGHTLLANFLSLAGMESSTEPRSEWDVTSPIESVFIPPVTPAAWPGTPPIADF